VMTTKLSLMDVFQGRRSLLIALGISVIVFLTIEMIIFIAFAASSGEHSRIEVRDQSGKLIYNVAGTTLSHLNFSYFERKYGDLDNYDVEIKTMDKPFPARAWISASVGVPTVLILLVSYLVRVYLTLLQGETPINTGNYPVLKSTMHPFISWSLFLSRSSIFFLGTVIAGLSLVFWMVPNFFGELKDFGDATLHGGSWFPQTAAAFAAVFAVWVVYLRYRLSRRMMDYQFHLERQHLDFQLRQQHLPPDDARPIPFTECPASPPHEETA
jgi:hypothetical protein